MLVSKDLLYAACVEYLEKRIENARAAMEIAQQAANEEGKSSAGDKYETTRAMMQAERDRHAIQLAEALRLQQELAAIHPAYASDSVSSGSLVVTSQGNFYVSISAGRIVLDGTVYVAVSPVSPVGAALLRKKAGDVVEFNGKTLMIESVS